MGFVDSLLVSLLGMSVVFLVLIILMTFITITSKVLGNNKKAPAPAAAGTASVAQPAAAAAPVYAKGSAGTVKTFDVPDRTAAMLMSIVAEQSETPLNQLKFLSIKEVDAK